MAVEPDLIFDVGVCNGDDSAYYLHKGYRVIGVEANPLLLPGLRKRFEREIADGRYELVGMGIAEDADGADFWVCDDHPEWSSFDRSIASRNGCRHHSVRIRTCRFGTLLESYGTPYFCKIDIEGNDELCLDDIGGDTRPKYLSIEVIDGHPQIERLAELGYSRFKLVSQRTLRQPAFIAARAKSLLPAPLRWLLTNVHAKLTRSGRDGRWTFPGGCSGPFGEDSRGEWLAAGDALELARLIERSSDLSDWHDIHAALA